MRFALGLRSVPLDADEPLPPEEDRVFAAGATVERIFRAEKSGLVRFVTGRSRHGDAEDIVQQAFERFFARGNADQIENPGAYLRQTAINLMHNDYHRAKRRPASEIPDENSPHLAGHDPVLGLEARDRLRRLEEAVEKLRPLTRQIFLARRVYGYSLAEICKQTGLSQKGVEKHMGIAIKKLGRHLHSHD